MCSICEYLVKQTFLAGDETKHMLLFIFHALYMCLIAEVLQYKQKKKEGWVPCKYYLNIL